jgi:uncharacterized membrane protein YdjX (TVP38/TMEM64 family)
VTHVLRSRFLWSAIFVVGLGWATNRWIGGTAGAEAAVRQFGVWAPIVAWTLKMVTTMTPVGAVVMSIAVGGLFPFATAVLVNLSSGVVGGLVMYHIWRRGNHEFDIQSRIRRLPPWLHRHAGDNLWFLVALRLLPWAGGTLADMIAGAHQVRVRTQVISLVLGYLPGAILYTLIGAGLLRR